MADEARRALAPLDVGELERAGLLKIARERDGAHVRAIVRIDPFEDLFLAHDPEELPLAKDHVAGISPAARTLAALTVRRPVARALDLGTGSGVQALIAARHTERVVAVDVNRRALRLAELNAGLNSVTNVEWREGNLFDPVRGSAFDLVAANPPFVVSPGVEYVFRDSGAAGDEISRAVVSQAGSFLREGGFAHVLASWVRRRGDAWEDAPRSWVEGCGCDAWLLHIETTDPRSYAAKWNEQFYAGDPDGFLEAVKRWIGYYRREGIEAVATGAVVLRRRDGRNWVRADELRVGPSGSAGEHVLRVFEAQDLLQRGLDDRSLLAEVLVPAAPHRLEQAVPYRDGGYAVQEARLLLDDGVGVVPSVSPQAAHVLFLLDDERSLGDALDEIGAHADVLAEMRTLLELGFLVTGPRVS